MRIFDGDQIARFLTEAGFSEVILNRNAKKALALRAGDAGKQQPFGK